MRFIIFIFIILFLLGLQELFVWGLIKDLFIRLISRLGWAWKEGVLFFGGCWCFGVWNLSGLAHDDDF